MTSSSPAPSLGDTYWPRVLASADAARARAQSGFTIASAIATGLVAAGLFTDVADRSHPARYVGGAALALWLAAMLLFLFAVASRTGSAAPTASPTERKFTSELLANVETERRRVESRLRIAVVVTSAAVLVTAATLVIGSTSLSVDRDKGNLVLNRSGVVALAGLCGARLHEPHGQLDVPTLRSDFVLFHLDAGECGKAKTDVRIPRGDVLAFVENKNQ